MYSVSQDYIDAIKSAVTRTALEFDINGTTYTDENILKGSFSITNQCTNTSDIKLGAVYSAELKATLRGIGISRNNWRGKIITPIFKLQIDEENDVWEDVPLGVFTVSEANWSASGIQIKAYDNMMAFDRPFTIDQSSGFLYDFLVVACDTCNITLGQTEEEITALPNGGQYFSLDASGISTWRDLISWIAQTMGGFATINRDGELEIRTYAQNIVDTLGTSERLKGAMFSDYITSYTAITYHDNENGVDRYFPAAQDTGATMELGANPFMQVENQGATACQNLLPVLALMTYVPFKASNVVRDPAYDLGDCLTFQNGLAGTQSLCCVQRYNFNLHNKYEMQGYGADPNRSSAKSRTDKSMNALMNKQSKDEMAFYEVRNISAINISSSDEKQILRLKLASMKSTRAEIHIEVNMQTEADNEFTIPICKYLVNGDEDDLHPTETYVDGKHVLHLMYILPMASGAISYFILRIQASGGSIFIARQGAWLYASGLGLVGDSVWDGNFEFEEEVSEFDIPLGLVDFFGNVSENIDVSLRSPINLSFNEGMGQFNIPNIDFATANDVMRIVNYEDTFQRVLENEDGLTQHTRGTEDFDGDGKDIRYTEQEV